MKTVTQLIEETQLHEAAKTVTGFSDEDVAKVIKTHTENKWVAHEDVNAHLDSLLKQK